MIGKADMSQVREELDKLRDESLTIGGGVAPGAGGGSGDLQDILRALVAQGNVGRGTLDFLAERFKGGGGAAPGAGDIDMAWYQRNAAKMISTITSYLPTARRDSDFQRLLDRVTRAEHYADHSGDDKLIDALKDLRETLERRREEARTQGGGGGSAGGGGGPTPPPPPAPPGGAAGGSGGFGGSLASWLSQQGGQGLRGLLGGAVGNGAAGFLAGAAGRLLTGPVGWVAGGLTAANMAFNAVSSKITGDNAPARQEIVGMADLARQYGSDRDFFKTFRDGYGWTKGDFAKFGYTGTEAARVAAIYDRPSGERLVEANAESIAAERARGSLLKNIPGVEGFRRADSTAADMKNDVTSILAFARTTGTDEQQAARAARTFGIAGVGGIRGGNADDSLRTMKLAMTEGVKAGIAGSDTMNSLVGFAQRNYSEGRSTSLNGLAAFAMYTQRLNKSGDAVLRGENAGRVVESFTKGIGNATDPGMSYFLIQALGKLPSADKLGLVNEKGNLSKEGTAYEQLRAESPLEAGRYLLSRMGSLDNPALLGQVSKAIDDASGGSTYLKKMMYEQLMPDLSQQMIMSIIGGGGLEAYFASNPKELARYKQGESALDDVQGGNRIANDTMQFGVNERDRDMINSFASLKIWGGLEGAINDLKNSITNLKAWFADNLGGYGNAGGSMAGRAGQGYVNPSKVNKPLVPAPRLPTPDETAAAVDTSGQAPTPGAEHLPGGTLTGTNRLLAAMSMKESSNGANPRMDAGSASGLFQMMGGNLLGAQGWDKLFLGREARNPDGSLVGTRDQGIAWLRANPGQADQMAVNRLTALEKDVREVYAKAGIKNPSERDVAQMVGAAWHKNGGADLRPFLDAKGKPLDPTSYSHKPNADGVSDFDYASKLGRIYDDPNLRPAALRGGARGPGQTQRPPPSVTGDETAASKAVAAAFAKISTDPEVERALRKVASDCAAVAGMILTELGANVKQSNSARQLAENAVAGGGQVITDPRQARPGDLAVYHNPGVYGGIQPNGKRSGYHVTVVKGRDAKGNLVEVGNDGDEMVENAITDLPHVKFIRPAPKKPKGDAKGDGSIPWEYGRKFARGGYTGNEHPSEEVGVVHGQEFVLNAEATARIGRANLEAMNAGHAVGGAVSVNAGGVVHVNVQLSPAAQREVHEATRAYHTTVGEIVRRDVPNHAGVR